jgi:DNA-binding NarL/FixJ family response regulator
MNQQHRVALVEDHLLQRRRTEQLLSSHGMRIVSSTESLPELVAWLRGASRDDWPTVIVLDLVVERQPNADPETVERLIALGITVVVLSALASPAAVRRIIRAGASAVIGKRDSEEDIIEAVLAAIRGETWMTSELAAVIASDSTRPHLSDQEERAMMLYASGLTLGQVAVAIGVKPDTAKKYLDRVKTKYSDAGRPVRTKTDLSRAARADGYLEF